LVFAKKPPEMRVLTLQLNNDHFLIPAGERDFRVAAWGSIPNDALLLSVFPHMHLRGKSFLFALNDQKRGLDIVLNVPNYDFFWQLSYHLKTPIRVAKGTRLECVATFDNSANNPRNPDSTADVKYGQQSWEEMMIGFFDVAVDAKIGKPEFFTRH
jgi:hypothetical protein